MKWNPLCLLILVALALLTQCSDDDDETAKKAQSAGKSPSSTEKQKPVAMTPATVSAVSKEKPGALPDDVPDAIKGNEMIQRYLNSASAKEREDTVAFAMSKCTTEQVRPLLQAALKDESPAVRQRSLAMINGLRPPDQADLLAQAVISPYQDIHEQAIEDAGRLSGEFAERAWAPALKAGNQRAVKGMLEAFDRSPQKHWVDWMLAEREHTNETVQPMIIEQIARWAQLPEGVGFASLEQAAQWWAANTESYDNYMLRLPGKPVVKP